MTKPTQKTTILRRRDVQIRCGLSCSTIYDRMNLRSPRYDASFPKPIRLGAGTSIGWIESEVEQWLQGRIAASRSTG